MHSVHELRYKQLVQQYGLGSHFLRKHKGYDKFNLPMRAKDHWRWMRPKR